MATKQTPTLHKSMPNGKEPLILASVGNDQENNKQPEDDESAESNYPEDEEEQVIQGPHESTPYEDLDDYADELAIFPPVQDERPEEPNEAKKSSTPYEDVDDHEDELAKFPSPEDEHPEDPDEATVSRTDEDRRLQNQSLSSIADT